MRRLHLRMEQQITVPICIYLGGIDISASPATLAVVD